MATTALLTTAEQLLDAPGLGPCELVRGELIMMSPAGFEHCRIAANLTAALVPFVRRGGLGVVLGTEGGFVIGHDPDTVRAPDVAFVSAARVPEKTVLGFFRGAPDLAVEVVSPNDRASDVLLKVLDWLRAGCRMVWVVDPQTRTVSVHRGPKEVSVLDTSDSLNGNDVLPGFTLPVADVFAA